MSLGSLIVSTTLVSLSSVHIYCAINIFNLSEHFSCTLTENMRLGIDAVGQGGGIVEAAVCYTGDVSDPKCGLYDLEYYLNFVRELEAQGIHVLAIKGEY